MRELFVYYRVRSIDARAAQDAVLALHAELVERCPGLRARLLRRPEETDGQQTWMETYSTDPMRVPAGITEAMQADIEARAHGLSPFVQGTRHTEVFIACAPQRW